MMSEEYEIRRLSELISKAARLHLESLAETDAMKAQALIVETLENPLNLPKHRPQPSRAPVSGQ